MALQANTMCMECTSQPKPAAASRLRGVGRPGLWPAAATVPCVHVPSERPCVDRRRTLSRQNGRWWIDAVAS
jgi:hypothetical protein